MDPPKNPLTKDEIEFQRKEEHRLKQNIIYPNDATRDFYRLPLNDAQREKVYNAIMKELNEKKKMEDKKKI
jgi:hypothetical protein